MFRMMSLKVESKMVKITVVNEKKTIEVQKGTPLKEALKDTKILFGCTNGFCGVCVCNIIKGKENLSEPTENEKEQLNFLKTRKNQRLACQCKVLGDITIEYVNEFG